MSEPAAPSLSAVIEAMLFVSGGPLEIADIARVLEATELEIGAALDALEKELDAGARGICLKRFGDHVQLNTNARYAPFVQRLLQPVQRQSLSQAALETLAIVAYHQPVTRLDIEAIRGVKCDYSIQSLIQKGLVADIGRRDTLGRPILYGTTDAFLSHFGLRTLSDLPPRPDQTGEDAQDLVP